MGASCLDDFSCTAGSLCVVLDDTTATCLATCDAPGDPCDGGGTCVATRDDQPPVCIEGDRQAGDPCTSDVQCTDQMVCAQSAGASAGVCTPLCDNPGGLCEDGELCLPGDSATSVCVQGGSMADGEACESSTDCVKGSRCLSAGDAKLCVRACEQDAQCREGMVCEALMGEIPGSVCRPGVGAACASGVDCPEPTSCSSQFEDKFFFANLWPDGVCAQETCTPGTCTPGSVCSTIEGMGSVCAPECESDADCRVTQGWQCLDASACEEGKTGCMAYFADRKLCHRPDRVWVLQ